MLFEKYENSGKTWPKTLELPHKDNFVKSLIYQLEE